MSTAGIHSNRGDSYQTLVAFDWALSVLEDPQYLWIDIDSVEYPIDDVVIRKSDGTLICCQCKKNQPAHRAWSFGDLEEELEKAIGLMAENKNTIVKFYSRSPFGKLANLREHYEIQSDEQSFIKNLPKVLLPTYEKLDSLTSSIDNKLTTYDVIKRISYYIDNAIDRQEDYLRKRLHRIASNSVAAFNAIWTLLDRHGARIYRDGDPDSSFPGKITKEKLKQVVEKTGAVLLPLQDTKTGQPPHAPSIARAWKRYIQRSLQKEMGAVLNQIIKGQTVQLHQVPIIGRAWKKDIQGAFQKKTGTALGQIQDIKTIQSIYHQASRIGRSWKRKIKGLLLETPLVKEIMSAIHEKARSILITGGPGSGKTCLLLNLQEELEKPSESNSDIVPLFVQAREFANCKSQQNLEGLGYPKELINITSRLAKETNVVVVFDSLDVLSISGNHWILEFFLTQIDQLLSIPNVIVVVACRAFDRKYDRRIAVHTWEREFECPPLSWEDQILPLLKRNNISDQSIEEDTRELIKNPRELDLFVELSLKEENVNHVSSQELAERYIDVVIDSDPSLGDGTLEAIEDIADEMLKTRSLVVPSSRFSKPDLLPKLQSLNILQSTQNNMITLGHQTLLDVLIVRKMYRKNITLHKFISDLKPVPFVRPSIRNVINYLSIGDKKTFRKQIRTVLTSELPFHIRRLAAEKISTFIPSDDYWPLLRDLRENHKEVFQVIYFNAHGLQWFDFWNKYLVPVLRTNNDTEDLITHAHRINQWKNDKPKEVITFWKEILEMNLNPNNNFISLLSYNLFDIDIKYADHIVPILDILLKSPRQEHSYLGRTLAKYVTAKVIDIKRIWDYIVKDLNDDDIKEYNFDNKLHYAPHEFGNGKDKFLSRWMNESKTLLDLAINDIERWRKIKRGNLNDGRISYWESFLSSTSYEKTHSQHDLSHIDRKNELFSTVESSIINHANNNSDWWIGNKDRLTNSPELSFQYFVILACTSNPEKNIEIIQRILTNQAMLESDLSYEIGLLIKQSFIHLKPVHQERAIKCILNLYNTNQPDSDIDSERVQKAKYIKHIPAYQRSTEAQKLLDSIEKNNQPLELLPDIHLPGGIVVAPFAYEIFLNNLSNDHIIDLLKYYNDFPDNSTGPISLFGVKRAVGGNLGEASSRNPQRFLDLIRARRSEISDYFVDQIIDGIAWFIEYKYGNSKAPDNWELAEEPDISYILKHLLDILDRISKPSNNSWFQSRAIKACAHIINSSEDAFRIIFLVLGYRYVHADRKFEQSANRLIQAGINMTKGHVAGALIILANRLIDKEIPFPDILVPALSEFIQDEHPAVRAVILYRLPYFLYHRPDDGWNLLDSALYDSEGLWAVAEESLYQMYNKHYNKVSALLERLYNIGTESDYETWGRVSAFSVFAGHIDIENFIKSLSQLKSENAWKGALIVWTNSGNIKAKEKICLRGIKSGLESDIASTVAAKEMFSLFHNPNFIPLPIEIVTLYLTAIAKSGKNGVGGYGLAEWLNKLSQIDPESALYGMEAYIERASQKSQDLYDFNNNLTQLMTWLFAEAEELEESDKGSMLQRVVSIQDKLLMLGVVGIDEWLKAAERP